MPIELPPEAAAYSDRNPPTRHRHVLLFVGLMLGTVIGVIGLTSALADGLVQFIPPAVEQRLGAAIVSTFEDQAQPSPTQDTLNQLLDRLETALPSAEVKRDYQVLYIPETTVNALAIPGDRIIIYAGLLDQIESENELMMVLGHELGHFANRDHLRGLSRQIVMRLALSSLFGDFGSLGSLATSSVSALSNAQFSQRQERQADEVGLQLLYQTYGHAAGATDFFMRLSQNDTAVAFLSTHPTSQSRVRRMEAMIRDAGYPIRERSPLPPSLSTSSAAS